MNSQIPTVNRAAALAAAALFLASLQTLAHHSNAVIDKDNATTVSGTVTQLVFANPHPAIYFDADVKDRSGNVVNWFAAGGGGVLSLRKVGWTNKTLKPGDRILILGHQSKDGRPLMGFRKLYRCSGEEVQLGYDPANRSEYSTRVTWEDIPPERVRSMCEQGTLVGTVGGSIPSRQ
jgi:hypothetical protein